MFDPSNDRLYIANSIAGKLDIVNFSDPSAPTMFASIDITSYGGINSVAVHNGLVALSIENVNPQLNGSVVFLDGDGAFINQVEVGAMPDMITFNKDYTKIITANEGEPNSDYSLDPEGSVSIIDLTPGVANLTNSNVTTLSLSIFNGQEASLIAQGVRIFSTSATVGQDLEPEYVVVSDDNTKAYVSLQENNAMLVVDLTTNTILSLNALGYSDYSSGNGMDASDQTGQILITSLPVKGAYMPDAMAYSTINGQGYVFTANEGDSREFGSVIDAARISTLSLDPVTFPDQPILKNNRFLGRLSGLRYSGDTDNDGDLDEIHVMGGRSFSIWNAETGELVYDSKDLFEQITAAHPEFSAIFNASNTATSPALKNRSDDKGPEPEGVTTAFINGSHYVFVSMERIGGAMIFNVDDPANPVYVGYENNRLTTGIGPDLGAEGMIFIAPEDSPNGNGLLILANEVSSTLSIYQVNTCAELSNTIVSADQTEFCFGDNATLSVATDASSIQWVYNGSDITNETSSEFIASLTGEYAVFVSNPALSCSGLSERVEILVNELPEVSANASALILCEGEELILSGEGALNYSWTGSVNDGEAFVPSSTETYIVEGEDENGCISEAEVTVVVNALPIITANASAIELCSGTSVVLSGSGATSYQWDNDVENNVSFIPSSTETYTVVGTDDNGCSSSHEVLVTVRPNPVLDLGDDITVCSYNLPTEISAPSGFTSYEWTGANATQSLTVYVAGTYTCTVSNEFGCEDSDELSVAVDACLGVDELENAVSIYPNPFSDQLTIQLGNWVSSTVQIYDMNGALILDLQVPGSEMTINLDAISSGVYVLKVINGSETYQTRIIKN